MPAITDGILIADITVSASIAKTLTPPIKVFCSPILSRHAEHRSVAATFGVMFASFALLAPSLVMIAPWIWSVLGFGKLVGEKSQNAASVGRSQLMSVKKRDCITNPVPAENSGAVIVPARLRTIDVVIR